MKTTRDKTLNRKNELAPVVLPAGTVLTEDQFKKALPSRCRRAINKDIMASVNEVMTDVTLQDSYRENLLTYSDVLLDGRLKVTGYIEAIKFVTCILLGKTDRRAWEITFPDRAKHYNDLGTEQKDIASIVTAYKKGMLVTKIIEQTLIPTHILNAGLHQKAINQLAHLMMHATSEKVQSDSAAKLVDALKIPETTKIELDVSVRDDQSISELRQTTLELVAQQKLALSSGAMSPKQVAESKLVVIEGESEEIG